MFVYRIYFYAHVLIHIVAPRRLSSSDPVFPWFFLLLPLQCWKWCNPVPEPGTGMAPWCEHISVPPSPNTELWMNPCLWQQVEVAFSISYWPLVCSRARSCSLPFWGDHTELWVSQWYWIPRSPLPPSESWDTACTTSSLPQLCLCFLFRAPFCGQKVHLQLIPLHKENLSLSSFLLL